ncbi:MAG: amidohydrolase family protein [Ferroplasma sp.]|uniref:metal-dependent hydrolase family protein n=1 Tax=Ferroplasma sp. TaxID=2591003 RepID=UPI002814F882|nr:amidohydrolase family protein [Ferroplasma sp.]WMT51692.1 MAG: amidohydrolase family protein [Ferroplasma sp.]
MKYVIKGETLFDGNNILNANSVLIEDGIIKEVGNNIKSDDVREYKGAFIMPGMIDSHIHLTGAKSGNLIMESLIEDPNIKLLATIPWLNKILKAGFTTVRDCGGTNAIYLRNAIKNGYLTGPDIIAAGKPLSQTFGHGEFSHTIPIKWNEDRGMSEICDGTEGCIKGARTVLRQGADFIKIFSTGGVLSQSDRPDQEQFTVEEIRAIVNEARKSGTYVAAHAHGDQGVKNAVISGVKSIEHATMASDETLKLMAEKNVSLTPTLSIQELLFKYGREIGVNSWGLEKITNVIDGIKQVLPKAKNLGINILCGTDLGFETGKDIDIGKNWNELILMTKYGNMNAIEALRSATGNVNNIGIHRGRLSIGYKADVLIINGEPSENISDIAKIDHVYLGGNEVF